ncbi:MAG: CarD family transcriptional regulator [Myxococcota bacterium]|jgi:CarD family transcriptional regulator|nr:CarD family transcriptional regulator [Myxococcota bacterium]
MLEREWNIGDKAVYPSHGVGQITAIEQNDLFGHGAMVYVLELLYSPRRILIPIAKASQVGLREVVEAEEASRILASLRDEPAPSKTMPWTKRQRALLEKLSSVRLSDVAEVLRELYHLKGVKDLSFGQKRLFDTATALLVGELCVALGRDVEEIENEIRAIFA